MDYTLLDEALSVPPIRPLSEDEEAVSKALAERKAQAEKLSLRKAVADHYFAKQLRELTKGQS